MLLTQKQIDFLQRRKIVVLATTDFKAKPRAILVEVNQVKNNELIITDNEMKVSRANLLKNNQVFILAFAEDFSSCLKISGVAKYYQSGKYFDFVKGLADNKKFSPQGAIIITPKKIIELK